MAERENNNKCRRCGSSFTTLELLNHHIMRHRSESASRWKQHESLKSEIQKEVEEERSQKQMTRKKSKTRKVLVSDAHSDAATILNLVNIVQRDSKLLFDIVKSESEVVDCKTTIVPFCAELLKESENFLQRGFTSSSLTKSFRNAATLAMERIGNLAVSIEGRSKEDKHLSLIKCASRALSSKLVGEENTFLSTMVVDAVAAIGSDRLNLICIKNVPGGTMHDSFLVNGVAFKKVSSHAGFQQQLKKLNPKILALNLELKLKSEEDNSKIRLSDPLQLQSIVDAERIMYDKLEKCVHIGVKIVVSCLAISGKATQYFADRGIFCVGPVAEEDLQQVSAASGAIINTSIDNVSPEILGTCEVFEERQVGNANFDIFSGCPSSPIVTIVLCGGTEQFITEAERIFQDTIMIVSRAMKNSTVVAGGGAIEMELSRHVKQHAHTFVGKSKDFVISYANALEVIPRQLCEYAGFDAGDVLIKLRKKHAHPSDDGFYYGVDINTGGIVDSYANCIWEPAVAKINAINAATEAACLVLSGDVTIKNLTSESAQGDAAARALG